MEIYVRTASGISQLPCYKVHATEPWSFNQFVRLYDNNMTRTKIPDQYIAVDVYDYVSEFQIYYKPPVKDYGYVSRLNAVLAVPKRNEKIMANNYYVACEDNISIGINNPMDGRKFLNANTDDKDLVLSWDGIEYSDNEDQHIDSHTQRTLTLKALHTGKIAHLMVLVDKNKE